MNDRKIKHNVNIVVTTRHGDTIGQSFPLIEVLPNHCDGWCVAESKAKTCGGWMKGYGAQSNLAYVAKTHLM